MVKIIKLTVDMLENPLGIDNFNPQFGWKLKSDKRNFIQKAYQITVWDAYSKDILWDSGKVLSEDSPSFFQCQYQR